MEERRRPWAPVEAEPAGGWPPVADAVPVVVRAWARLEAGGARPALPTIGTSGASFKGDESPARVRRFAEAWRRLRAAGAGWAWPRDPKARAVLLASGVFVPILPPRRRGGP